MISEQILLPCGAVIKNRIAKSAMSENMAKSHCPGKEFERLYGRWACGGAGLVITGNVMVDPTALNELNNVVISKENDFSKQLKSWALAGEVNNTHLWVQLNHPGKQSPSFICKRPVAPSAIGYSSHLKKYFNPPRELTEAEIWDIIERFAYAAEVAKNSGFTGVQIHGAHGYLIAQFLSNLHNQRQDKWGGSLENRMRFVLEIYSAIRKKVGTNFPVGIKLNSADFQRGGFTHEESLKVGQKLASIGIDLIELSGGSYESSVMMDGIKGVKESTQKREAYFAKYCHDMKKLIDVPVLLTGGFRTGEAMQMALQNKDCDMVGLARSLAIDPDFANKILQHENAKSLVRPLSSGLKSIDKTIPLEITWYTQQLHRMGKGKEPRPYYPVKMSLVQTLFEVGVDALKRVRVK